MNVLLLRNPTQDSEDRYYQCLSALGFIPHSVPVLDTVLTGLERVEQIILRGSEGYDGVVVTSSRGVEAWRAVVEKLLGDSGISGSATADWSSVPFYVVGSATADALRSIPASLYTPAGANIRGWESGNGEALARFVVDDLAQSSTGMGKRVLYLMGDKNRDTFVDVVGGAGVGIEVVGVRVYETRGSVSFAGELRETVRACRPFDPAGWWIVFFAPSSAEFALPFLREHFRFSEDGSCVKVAAIGQTTKTHLVKLGIRVDAVASKPSPEGLAASLSHN